MSFSIKSNKALPHRGAVRLLLIRGTKALPHQGQGGSYSSVAAGPFLVRSRERLFLIKAVGCYFIRGNKNLSHLGWDSEALLHQGQQGLSLSGAAWLYLKKGSEASPHIRGRRAHQERRGSSSSGQWALPNHKRGQ
jgi:hypothetical protein